MSSLIFPNILAKPGSGVLCEFAFDGSKPAVDGGAGERVDFMGASCSPDPGNEGECGKRLSDSLWASEDLSCGSEIRRDVPTSRGSPEWTGAADAQRAISLDAAECLTEMSNLSLVRSMALEDLTSIGDQHLWVSEGEELVSAQTKDGVTADGAALKSCSDSESKNINPEKQQLLHTQSLSHSGFDSHSEDPHPAHISRNISEKDRLFTEMPSGTATENSSSDSSSHRASYSRPEMTDSDMRGNVAQTTGTAELQKTPPQSSPARKSLVPVAIFKGLCAVIFTSSESSSVNSFHFFLLQRSFYCMLCCTLPPMDVFYDRRRSLLSSLPTLAFWFHLFLVMQPDKATFFFFP